MREHHLPIVVGAIWLLAFYVFSEDVFGSILVGWMLLTTGGIAYGIGKRNGRNEERERLIRERQRKKLASE